MDAFVVYEDPENGYGGVVTMRELRTEYTDAERRLREGIRALRRSVWSEGSPDRLAYGVRAMMDCVGMIENILAGSSPRGV